MFSNKTSNFVTGLSIDKAWHKEVSWTVGRMILIDNHKSTKMVFFIVIHNKRSFCFSLTTTLTSFPVLSWPRHLFYQLNLNSWREQPSLQSGLVDVAALLAASVQNKTNVGREIFVWELFEQFLVTMVDPRTVCPCRWWNLRLYRCSKLSWTSEPEVDWCSKDLANLSYDSWVRWTETFSSL